MLQIDTSTLAALRQAADIIEEVSEYVTYIGILAPATPGTDNEKQAAAAWMIVKVEQAAAEGVFPNVTTATYAENAPLFNKIWNNRATYSYKYSDAWIGVEWLTTSASPDVTRIGNMNLHKADNHLIKRQMKTALKLDNGTLNYYLNPTDWTKKEDGSASKLDGTDGHVATKLPTGYWCFVTAGNLRQIKFSEVMQPASAGWFFGDHIWVGSFEGSLNRTSLKLASVVNNSTTYRGGNNTSAWDAASNSLLGKPATNLSRTLFRTYARNTGANCQDYFYSAHKYLWWAFVLQYATLNSQKPVVAALTTEGYFQGGLGNGVITADGTQWNNFNGYNPFVNCGASNSLASNSGEVSVVIPDFGGAGVSRTFTVPRFNGIENPFGHIWKNLDGINIKVQSVAAGNESQAWVSNTPANWNDSNYTGYTNVGLLPRADGYISDVLFGSSGEFLPKLASGGSTTYYCDYLYTSIPGSGESLRALLVGGAASAGAIDGFVAAYTTFDPSSATANIGSRLCFLGA